MGVACRLHLDWQGDQLSVPHSALGGDVLGEMTDVVHRPHRIATSGQLSWSKCTYIVASDRSWWS
jgi:hypothetical protein